MIDLNEAVVAALRFVAELGLFLQTDVGFEFRYVANLARGGRPPGLVIHPQRSGPT